MDTATWIVAVCALVSGCVALLSMVWRILAKMCELVEQHRVMVVSLREVLLRLSRLESWRASLSGVRRRRE